MPDPIVERVRSLVQAFLETDLLRLRIERDGGHVELRRRVNGRVPEALPDVQASVAAARAEHIEPIKADLVGIFHLGRPLPVQGERLETDRELAYVEALGIRNPVRSRGGGRLVSVCCGDGEPVEYGQTLFEIDRS